MAFDPYDPCPCGSGKKLKFCCQPIVGEMQKVARFRQSNQSRMALQVLDALEKKHPGNPWVVTSRATILMDEGGADEAAEVLEDLLEQHPEHPFALALFAIASFTVDGYEMARQVVHRAFQRCAAVFPDLIAGLAMSIADEMLRLGKSMACRQHLVLAMRLAAEEDKQEIFLHLLEYDGNPGIPYPLRSVHELAEYSGPEESKSDAAKAVRLSTVGCWGPAARIFSRLAEQEPQSAGLWQNAGLCRAWDGDEIRAARALHEAARLHDDFETAVECETIAQLLDLHTAEDRIERVSARYDVKSVARLLSQLDEQERIARASLPPQGEEGVAPPAGMVHILDRPLPAAGQTLTLEAVPRVLAQVFVYDAVTDQEVAIPPRAYVIGRHGEEFDGCRRLFEDAADEQVEFVEIEQPDEEWAIDAIPRELQAFFWSWHFPAKTPLKLRRDLEQQKWDQLLGEVWPNTPLAGLNGKTPVQAGGDPELKVPLAAAVSVLDSVCEQRGRSFDLNPLRERLGVAPPRPVRVSENTPLNALSAMQLLRLPLSELSDSQITTMLNRALLIRHGEFLYRVLIEVVRRPACGEQADPNRVYMTLVDLSLARFRRDEALRWIEEGRQSAKSHEKAFELVLQWDLRELSLRLDDPGDPALNPLLQRFAEYYGPKLPKLLDSLSGLLREFGVAPPWETGGEVRREAMGEGGVWTPSAPHQPGGEKKLWIPGQK